MRTSYPFLFEDEGTLLSHLVIKMTVTYAWNWMCRCV